MDTEKIREYFNYFLPREIIGPVFVVFALEHIIEILFTSTVPTGLEVYGWITLLTLSLLILGYWGLADDDYDDFLEDEIQ